jgi:selenocysteine-specific elongation factor
MADDGGLLSLPEGFYISAAAAESLDKKLAAWLSDYLGRHPLRLGAPKQEAAQSVFPWIEPKGQRAYFLYLASVGAYGQNETLIWPADWAPVVSGRQNAQIEAVRAMYGESLFTPPSWAEAAAAADIPPGEQDEILQWFLRSGELLSLSEDVVFTRQAIVEAERLLRASAPDGSFTLAEARDLLGATRKWAQLLAEYFDQTKATYRDGERRYWRA